MNRVFRTLSASGLTLLLAVSGTLLLSEATYAQRRTTKRSQPSAVRSAYDHGYTNGYNEGYSSGKTDFNIRADRDFERSSLYHEGNRGYERRFGDLSEYQDGFRLGFEFGYTDGYFGRTFSAKVPANASALRGPVSTPVGPSPPPRDSSNVPTGIDMKLRLTSALNTKTNREGDRFTAVVLEPNQYEGATVEGHISRLKRSGRLTGRTEMTLAFDQITFRDGSAASFRADVERIYATESVKTVDEEGHIETASRTTDTQVRTAGGAVLGAIIGGIAGGGKGAAIGAIVGAGAGAGSVYVQGNKDLLLDPGTEMLVRTTSASRQSGRSRN